MGPVWSAAICAVGDILGMLINSAGKPYLPLFTISAAVRGIVYGLTLHGKKPSIVRSVIAVGIVTLIVDLGMNSLWLAQMISSDWLAVFLIKLPTRLITIPVYALVLFAVWKGMESAKLTEGK